MADESLIEKVHDLSDLELGILLSLISREHCLISTPRDALDDLVEELQLVRRSPLPLDIAWSLVLPPSSLAQQLTLFTLGSIQNVRPQERRRRLQHSHHHRRLCLGLARHSSAQQPQRIALDNPVRLLLLLPTPLPSQHRRPPLLLHAPAANCELRHCQGPRPRPARRPDSSPRAAPNRPYIHPHLSSGRPQTLHLHPRARRR
jgi:hypothetical protein